MQKITLGEILKATGGQLLCGNENTEITAIMTDSRKVAQNALFVPFKGENADGHDYIEKAFENGAVAALCERKIETNSDKCQILVGDTSKALGMLAKYYKKKFKIKTIAITGSVGKTTTKDMLYAVMNMQYSTLKTEGNYNNEIGLPLTVFRLNYAHEAAVLEMGMSAFGEIRYLADIARPDVGIITNIGMSHIENLGSQEGIFKAKTEMCEFFDKNSLLIVNGDDKYLQKAKNFEGFSVITYGIENECDYTARNIENLGLDGTKFTVNMYGRDYDIHVKVPGVHNVYNALAAIACGVHYNIGPNQIIGGIENFALTKMRMSIEKAGTLTLINDCYNSSPDSVKAALKVLATQKTRKVAILGDILEMGDYSEKAHYELGKEVSENGIDMLITAGENAQMIAKGAEETGLDDIKSFNTTDELCEKVAQYLKEGDCVLIKASRGMHFEKIAEKIMEING